MMADNDIIKKRPFSGPTERISETDKGPFSGPISENLTYSDPSNYFLAAQQTAVSTTTEDVSEMFPTGTKIISCEFKSEKDYTAELRLKCKTKEEFKTWLTDFQNMSNTIYRVLYTTPSTGQKVLYKAVYRCHHNTYPSSHKVKTPSKKHTGCSAKLKVSIKAPVGPKSRTKDTLIEDYPTIIELTSMHNHEINAAASVKYKDINEEVREKFIELFRSQHGPSKALELHKRDLLEKYDDDYYKMQADRSICPDLSWTYRLYYKVFLEEFGETSKGDFFNSLKHMIDSSAIQSRLKIVGDDFVIVLCSPIMQRAHTLKRASETVFIDSSGNMDRFNCRVFLLMTDSCVGGLPLAVFISSSETEKIITTGLEMLKEIVPSDAFGGAGTRGPSVFLTDDSAAQQNSLSNAFPVAKIWLCSFHVLQAMWRWLWNAQHNIKINDRRDLFMLFKHVLVAQDEGEYKRKIEKLRKNEVALQYPNFLSHVEKYIERSHSWCLCFREDSKGNNTNNIVEAAMRVLKDKILCRTRAFNVQQLFHYLTENLSDYYTQKILDIISERNHNKNKYTVQQKKLLNLQLIGETGDIFTVRNTETNGEYEINLELGVCSCPVGYNGAPCKHQHYVSIQKDKSCHNIAPRTIEEKMKYHFIATGNNNIDPAWYSPLFLGSNKEMPETNVCEASLSNKHQSSEDENHIYQERKSEASVSDEKLCPEQEKPKLEDIRLIMKNITETLEANFKDNEIEFAKALKSMEKNICNIKTKAGLFSAMHNFGKIQYKAVACRKSTSIPVQPTAVQRRKFTVGTRRCLQTGRPAKSSFISEHGYAKRKKNAITILSRKKRATHCLQENIDRNILSNN